MAKKKSDKKTAPAAANRLQFEDDRTGLSVSTLKRAFADNLFYIQGKNADIATLNDYDMALAYTVRDRLCTAGWARSKPNSNPK